MFERFTNSARQVVVLAQQEARGLDHPHIGTQHVLLGILAADPDGPAGRVLHDVGVTHDAVRAEVARLFGPNQPRLGEADAEALQGIGIDLDAVRAKVEESFGPGALDEPEPDCKEPPGPGLVGRLRGRRRPERPRSGHIPFTPRAKKTLELSLREAIRLHHNHIGPEHLLLGLLREGEGQAAQILVESGVDLDNLRRRVVAAIERAA
jgi:ATP-dependent Clp protease ATP-binding subunit ClpA